MKIVIVGNGKVGYSLAEQLVREKHDITVVDVCNDGHPISGSSRKDIFVPFFTTKKEGSGIGLSLSRQIMRMHGGSITLLGSDLSGTTFRLTFR